MSTYPVYSSAGGEHHPRLHGTIAGTLTPFGVCDAGVSEGIRLEGRTTDNRQPAADNRQQTASSGLQTTDSEQCVGNRQQTQTER